MTTPLLATTLVRANHVRSFHVRITRPAGWEAAEHEDQRVIQKHCYTDWHRVELAIGRFARAIAELREQGWVEVREAAKSSAL